MGAKNSKSKSAPGEKGKSQPASKPSPQHNNNTKPQPEAGAQRKNSIDCQDPDYSTSVHPNGPCHQAHMGLELDAETDTTTSRSPNTTESDLVAPSGNFPATDRSSGSHFSHGRHSYFKDSSDSHQERLSMSIRVGNQQVEGIGTRHKLDQLLGETPIIHTSPVEDLESFHAIAPLVASQSGTLLNGRGSGAFKCNTIAGPKGRRSLLSSRELPPPSNPLFRSSWDSHQERISFRCPSEQGDEVIDGIGTLSKLNTKLGVELPVVLVEPVEDLGSFHFRTSSHQVRTALSTSLSPHPEDEINSLSDQHTDLIGAGNAPPGLAPVAGGSNHFATPDSASTELNA